jgi:hypothetical protein
LLEGRDRSGEADLGAADRWAAADLLGGRTGSTEAANTWHATEAPDRRTGASSRHDSHQSKWLAADLLEPPPAPSAGRRRRGATTHEELNRPADDGSGRRRVPTAAEPGLDESAEHLDDAEPRHLGGNRHTASPPRVPPTQWAWPKEEPDPGPFEAVRAHRDTGAAWSAADLLEEGRHTDGRRRTREAARHGRPTGHDDEAAGRHYRP